MLHNDLERDGLTNPMELDNQAILSDLAEAILGPMGTLKNRHTDHSLVQQIFNDPNLQDAVASHFGRDLLLWRSNFFVKRDGSGEIGWHHDRQFEDGDKPIVLENLNNHFSILIAVTDMLAAGGEMQFLKGSYRSLHGYERDLRPYHLKPPQEHFAEIPTRFERSVESCPLKKGQFVLFHSAVMHGSKPFVSGPPRISMVGRLVRSDSTIPSELAVPHEVTRFSQRKAI